MVCGVSPIGTIDTHFRIFVYMFDEHWLLLQFSLSLIFFYLQTAILASIQPFAAVDDLVAETQTFMATSRHPYKGGHFKFGAAHLKVFWQCVADISVEEQFVVVNVRILAV